MLKSLNRANPIEKKRTDIEFDDSETPAFPIFSSDESTDHKSQSPSITAEQQQS
jgi:hypothetical protein